MDRQVFTAACADYTPDAVRRAAVRMLAAFGGAESFLKKGRRVVIKPNLLMARQPEGATTTHPEVVEAVAALFTEAGATVIIADSPGGPYNALTLQRVYRACGMEEAARRSGARLNKDCSSQKVEFDGMRKREFDILTPVLQADVLINIGKMKTHMLTYFTGAVKNCYGAVPGLTKAAYHSRLPGQQEFCRMLVDLCRCVAPDLSIIDGVEGMDGRGPSGGRVRRAGVLIASRNPFAADLAAMHICGLTPERSPVHTFASAQGLTPAHPDGLEMTGDCVPPLSEPFLPPAGKGSGRESVINRLPAKWRQPLRRAMIAAPRVTDRCIGCGSCARSCPRHAIVIRQGRAYVQGGDCIRCYCCHELCPVRAIQI